MGYKAPRLFGVLALPRLHVLWDEALSSQYGHLVESGVRTPYLPNVRGLHFCSNWEAASSSSSLLPRLFHPASFMAQPKALDCRSLRLMATASSASVVMDRLVWSPIPLDHLLNALNRELNRLLPAEPIARLAASLVVNFDPPSKGSSRALFQSH